MAEKDRDISLALACVTTPVTVLGRIFAIPYPHIHVLEHMATIAGAIAVIAWVWFIANWYSDRVTRLIKDHTAVLTARLEETERRLLVRILNGAVAESDLPPDLDRFRSERARSSADRM